MEGSGGMEGGGDGGGEPKGGRGIERACVAGDEWGVERVSGDVMQKRHGETAGIRGA